MKIILTLLIAAVIILPGAMAVRAQNGKPVLNHIAVYVKDLKTSTSFYMDILNLDTIPEPFHDGKHTWFRVSDYSHLHLIQGASGNTEVNKNNHLCFSVPSIDEVINKLKKAGISFESWAGKQNEVTTRVDGVKQIYFRDPDGFWLEFNNDYPKPQE